MKKFFSKYENIIFISAVFSLFLFTYLNFDYAYFLSAMRLYGG